MVNIHYQKLAFIFYLLYNENKRPLKIFVKIQRRKASMNNEWAFITGGTGFIGSHLSYELLKKPCFKKVVLLVRPETSSIRTVSAKERVYKILSDLNKDFLEWQEKLIVMEGDITRQNCGLSSEHLETLHENCDAIQFFHAAADIRFNKERRQEIFRTNLDGTRNVLDLIQHAKIRRFHYFSTAYVCGNKKNSVVYEDDMKFERDQRLRNPYEESKFEAEAYVRQESEKHELLTTIYRPSIVFGNSRTGACSNFAGYYEHLRAFLMIRDMVTSDLRKDVEGRFANAGISISPKDFVRLPVRIFCLYQAHINLVCIDYLTSLIINLLDHKESIGKTFHIVNPDPPFLSWILRTNFKHLKISDVRIVNISEQFDKILDEIRIEYQMDPYMLMPEDNRIIANLEQYVQKTTHYYNDYIKGEPIFDMGNVWEVLGKHVPHPTIDENLIGRLVRYAVETKFGKRKLAIMTNAR